MGTSDRVCSSTVFQAELAREPLQHSEGSNLSSGYRLSCQTEKALPDYVFFNCMHLSQRKERTKFSSCCRNKDSCENLYDMCPALQKLPTYFFFAEVCL